MTLCPLIWFILCGVAVNVYRPEGTCNPSWHTACSSCLEMSTSRVKILRLTICNRMLCAQVLGFHHGNCGVLTLSIDRHCFIRCVIY
ncbi:hypothetical protein FGO68_gene15860 [Halteria grandinella]|uniref:Secreted protein n=1 Tax=Halteria grandinella TaxID=5974 RepID=A0A8J8NJ69_HALGN|nr:hypothetical protein FGO68_gene15860 [Halteria grandinella]